jgi:hypothetical protein
MQHRRCLLYEEHAIHMSADRVDGRFSVNWTIYLHLEPAMHRLLAQCCEESGFKRVDDAFDFGEQRACRFIDEAL